MFINKLDIRLFVRAFLSAVFCISLTVVVFGQAPTNSSSAKERAEQTNAKPQDDKTPLILEAIQDALKRIASAIEAQKDDAESKKKEERETRDLAAQEKMALWTERIFYPTLASVVLTIVGLLLIWRTLVHTRKAAEAARDMVKEGEHATTAAREAAVEAKRQADLAEQSFKRIQRPYLFVTHFPEIMGDEPNRFVRLQLRNYGTTPALYRYTRIKWLVLRGDEAHVLWNPKEAIAGKSSSHDAYEVIAQNEESNLIQLNMPPDGVPYQDVLREGRRITPDGRELYCVLEIVFEDAFGVVRENYSCWKLTENGFRRMGGVTTAEHEWQPQRPN